MAATLATYPEFEEQLRELVGQHRKSKNGSLHLAVYFAPAGRDKGDVFLFEVIEGFGGGMIDPDNDLFEFGYGSTPGFPLPDGASLRMVLTNPEEFGHAVDHDWTWVRALSAAKKRGRAKVIHCDAVGRRLWDLVE